MFPVDLDAGRLAPADPDLVDTDGTHLVINTVDTHQKMRNVRRDPRVSIAITSKGSGIGTSKSLTYKGTCVVHEDDETKAWFYPALAARVRPTSAEQQAAFVHHLESPGRVVIEIVPTKRIGFDSEQMFKNSPAGKTSTEV